MGKQGFRDISSDPFVYLESVSGESVALGIDDTDDNFKISVLATAGANPSGTATIDIDIATNNTILSAGTLDIDATGALQINSSGGAISIGNDAVAQLINIGTGAAARTITIGNSTGTTSVVVNVGTGALNLGTTATTHTSTLGSVTGASSTVIQSGTGALNITSTNGVMTINSGTGALGISTDASATTVNIGTGAAVKTATFGSTNTTSATTINSGTGALGIGTSIAKTITIGNTTGATAVNINIGTGDFTMASASGTLISQLDTGEMTRPLQPAFLARNTVTDTNVTGTGTVYTVICDTEIFDQGSDYNNATGTFTAPVTGRYYLGGQATIVGTTVATTFIGFIVTSNSEWQRIWTRAASAANATCFSDCLADMDVGDVANFRVATLGEAADTDDVFGSASNITSFWGNLVC